MGTTTPTTLITPNSTSPVENNDGSIQYGTPNTPTPPPKGKGKGKKKDKGKGKDTAKMPSAESNSNGSSSSSVVPSTPIPVAGTGSTSTDSDIHIPENKNTPSTITSSASDPDTTIREHIADAMNSDGFRAHQTQTALESSVPQSLQHQHHTNTHTPLIISNTSTMSSTSTSSPHSPTGKDISTTSLSTSEPPAVKNILSHSPVASPAKAITVTTSHAMASPAKFPIATPPPTTGNGNGNVNSYTSYTSYTSFTHTPPRVAGTPSPPTPMPIPALPFPLPKATQSTPLLPPGRSGYFASHLPPHPHPHRATAPSTHTTTSAIPPGNYEYHTINGSTILTIPPLASQHHTSTNYNNNNPPNTSPPSSSSSQSSGCRSSCGIKTSLMCTYFLFTCSIIWLIWMSLGGFISDSGENGNGHLDPHNSSVLVGDGVGVGVYGAEVPVVKTFIPGDFVEDVGAVVEVDMEISLEDMDTSFLADPNPEIGLDTNTKEDGFEVGGEKVENGIPVAIAASFLPDDDNLNLNPNLDPSITISTQAEEDEITEITDPEYPYPHHPHHPHHPLPSDPEISFWANFLKPILLFITWFFIYLFGLLFGILFVLIGLSCAGEWGLWLDGKESLI